MDIRGADPLLHHLENDFGWSLDELNDWLVAIGKYN